MRVALMRDGIDPRASRELTDATPIWSWPARGIGRSRSIRTIWSSVNRPFLRSLSACCRESDCCRKLA